MAGPDPTPTLTQGLYGRALLIVLLGAGAVLGGVLAVGLEGLRGWQVAAGVLVLFVGATLLAVRSVVAPVRQLTAAVHRSDDARVPLPVARFGDDELGALARALERWRVRMAEGERQALAQEHLRAVVQAQEAERQRVGRELHDTVAQDLAALRLEIERLAGHAAPDPAALGALEAQAAEMLDTVRRILLDLRPTMLERLGFVPALEWLVERARAEHGLAARLVLDGDPPDAVADEAAVALFRAAQEALRNAARHGAAEQVFVTLAATPAALALTVEDDGRGFDPAAATGFGLAGIRERARLLGGDARVDSAPGEGTTVVVEIPRRAGAA